MTRIIRIITFIALSIVIILASLPRVVGFFWDFLNQQPPAKLTIYNYVIPSGLIIVGNIASIILLIRHAIFKSKLYDISGFSNNTAVKTLLFLLISYGLIFEIRYFNYLLSKDYTQMIIVDLICLLSNACFAIILLIPKITKPTNNV
jgi:hypothetical protein